MDTIKNLFNIPAVKTDKRGHVVIDEPEPARACERVYSLTGANEQRKKALEFLGNLYKNHK